MAKTKYAVVLTTATNRKVCGIAPTLAQAQVWATNLSVSLDNTTALNTVAVDVMALDVAEHAIAAFGPQPKRTARQFPNESGKDSHVPRRMADYARDWISFWTARAHSARVPCGSDYGLSIPESDAILTTLRSILNLRGMY